MDTVQACEPVGEWITIWRELSSTIGPAGAIGVSISLAFNGLQAYAMWKLVVFFTTKDGEKRQDVKDAFSKVDRLITSVNAVLADLVKTINNLRLALAKGGLDVCED